MLFELRSKMLRGGSVTSSFIFCRSQRRWSWDYLNVDLEVRRGSDPRRRTKSTRFWQWGRFIELRFQNWKWHWHQDQRKSRRLGARYENSTLAICVQGWGFEELFSLLFMLMYVSFKNINTAIFIMFASCIRWASKVNSDHIEF